MFCVFEFMCVCVCVCVCVFVCVCVHVYVSLYVRYFFVNVLMFSLLRLFTATEIFSLKRCFTRQNTVDTLRCCTGKSVGKSMAGLVKHQAIVEIKIFPSSVTLDSSLVRSGMQFSRVH